MSSITSIEKIITNETGYKKDLVGLSTETKPTNGVAGGSTFYCVDSGDLYVFYNGEWYLQEFVEAVENNIDTRTIDEIQETEAVEEIKEEMREDNEEVSNTKK